MKRRAPGYRFRPGVELLEDRELPAASRWAPAPPKPAKAPPAPPAKVKAPAPKAVTAPAKVTTAPTKPPAPAATTPSHAIIKPFSDVPNTPALSAKPGDDLTDTYLFPDPSNPNNVVVIMDVHPFIPPGQAGQEEFDPNLLYQMQFSTQDNGVEDLAIQFKFNGSDPATQQVQVAGPVLPERTGTSAYFEQPDQVTGTLNQTFTTGNGVKVFAGVAEDPFFFDLNQFLTILPDRANPFGPTFVNTHGQQVSTTPADPDQLMDSS
ncbi:MAG TPA: DUF4331 family protein, partial [Gemmataceae bacterium]|nr:DUF4331 family protein [Gemmataceae bacterium]